jgi:hypothetical protein
MKTPRFALAQVGSERVSRLQLDNIDSPTIDLVTSHGAVSAEGVLLFFYHIVQDLVVDLVQGPRIVLRHGQTPSL